MELQMPNPLIQSLVTDVLPTCVIRFIRERVASTSKAVRVSVQCTYGNNQVVTCGKETYDEAMRIYMQSNCFD